MPVQTGRFSLTSGVVIFSLCFNRTQLLSLALSLECLGENKASALLHLTIPAVWSRGPSFSYLRRAREVAVEWRFEWM